uniref:Cadherin domain-containing protein n=1 Tax=Pseudo-nitzschia australis TaxID=44445 RepID=A0A7S4ATE1_9STRA
MKQKMTIRFNTCILVILFASIIHVMDAMQLLPLLQYDMTTDYCHQGSYFNNGILGKESIALVRNTNTTRCVLGMGIESDFHLGIDDSVKIETSQVLYASKSIGSFLEDLNGNTFDSDNENENGFTISLWIRPHQNQAYTYNKQNKYGHDLTSPKTIFAIGSDTFERKTFPTALTSCEKSKIDFQLSMIDNDSLEIVYRTSNHMFEPCQRIEFNASSLWDIDDGTLFAARPTHISISLGNFRQQVLVNGKIMARRRESFDTGLKHWDPTSLLQFFDYPKDENRLSPLWDGQLFQFSIYRGVFNKNQVRSVISQGLPPSQPFARSKVAQIYEDALDENVTLQQIQMPYSFLDDEIDDLLTLLGLSHEPAAYTRYYITRFPSRGSLFHVGDKRTIEPNGNHPVLVRDMDSLVYIPRKDEHSEFSGHAYSSFDFCVTTNKIITSSQCISATISVIVDPINDPPVASIPKPYYVHEGINEEAQALLLTGSDVDKSDSIQTIQITSPPKLGYLFLSVSSFRNEDNLLHGTLLSTVNNTILGKEAYVEYQFTECDTVVIQDSSIVDFFRFRVQDSAGSWSAEAEVKVHVLSGISSYSPSDSSPWIAPMTQVGGVRNVLKGIDSSGMNRTLGFFFKSLPSKGIILDEGTQVMENHIAESTKKIYADEKIARMVNVTYVGAPAICDKSDDLLINDTFEYQVVALGPDKGVVSVSPTMEEQINVFCPVELVSMSVIDEEELMNVSAFVSLADDYCSGYLFDFSEESKTSCRNTTLVFGLNVDNVEKLPEPVYVSIKTRGGLLSLKQEDLEDFHPIFDQPVMRSSIHIILPAENLNDVLSAIHFQSDAVGMDEIQVVLQYGRCDHQEKFLLEHDFSEATTECYKSEKTINVNIEQNLQDSQLLHYPFPMVSLLVILILGPIFYIKGKGKRAIEDVFIEWQEGIYDDATNNETSLDV